MRHFLELGQRGTRTQYRDAHSGATQLLGQCLGQGDHIRFGRVVDRHQRPRREPGGGGDVQDPAAAPREHPGKKELGERGEGGDVDLDHPTGGVQVGLHERPKLAKPRVVHEHVHGHRRRPDLAHDLRRRRWVGQVGGDHPESDPVALPQLGTERLELLTPPGHEHEVVAVPSEQLRQLEPDPARRAGDQRRPGGHTRLAGLRARTASIASTLCRVTMSCEE